MGPRTPSNRGSRARGRLRVRRARLSRRASPCRRRRSSGSISRRATSRGWRPSSRTFASSRLRTSRSTRSSSSRRSSTSAPTTPCTGSRREADAAVEARGTPRARPRPPARMEACSSRCRSASPVITAWFRQEDEPGWTTLFAEAGFFVEEIEAYELTGEGWRAAPAFASDGRALRRTRPGRLGRSVRRSLPGPAAPAADPVRARDHRQASPSTSSASRAARTARLAAMDFELTADQREIQTLDARVRRGRDRPARGRLGSRASLPRRAVRRSSRSSG